MLSGVSCALSCPIHLNIHSVAVSFVPSCKIYKYLFLFTCVCYYSIKLKRVILLSTKPQFPNEPPVKDRADFYVHFLLGVINSTFSSSIHLETINFFTLNLVFTCLHVLIITCFEPIIFSSFLMKHTELYYKYFYIILECNLQCNKCTVILTKPKPSSNGILYVHTYVYMLQQVYVLNVFCFKIFKCV